MLPRGTVLVVTDPLPKRPKFISALQDQGPRSGLECGKFWWEDPVQQVSRVF